MVPLASVAQLLLPALAASPMESNNSPPLLLSVTSRRFFVQMSEPITVIGSGFKAGAVCRLTPSAYGARSGTTWTHGPEVLLSMNMTVINATHGICTPPDANGGVLVEGPGTLTVSNNGNNFSANELRIDYINLASIALGRRPYISESIGQVVFRSDISLRGSSLAVSATLPCIPSKTWHWSEVKGGTDAMLPLEFDGLPDRVHNDMKFTVTLAGGGSFSVWRRFMRVPPPPTNSSIEPVQLDATRGGILIDGRPWLGRGYYMSGLNNNVSIPEKQRWSVPKGIATEIERLTKAIRPEDPPVINMGEIYGLGSFEPADQLAVLDAAAKNGFKVQYDMTNPGIQIDGGGPFDNDTALHWLRSNVTLVRNHKALLGYYICDDCCTDWHSTSMQAQVYSIIKDLDPYHATIGASDCANSWMFRDVATMIPPTVRRSSVWMDHGQPALQLSLDLVMQENYGTSLIEHSGTGKWDKRIPGKRSTLGHDGDFVHGMFQEPVINCDGNFNQGHEFPHFATNGTIPPAWFRSMLWLGAVTANMVNQLVFVLGPSTPFELTDVMSAWAAEELELMPSLYGKFGQRDSVLATVASAEPAVTFGALRARAWSENAACVHVVVVNANTTTPSRFTLKLTGNSEGWEATSTAQRLFEARYIVPVSTSGGSGYLVDWIGPAQTNVYRLGRNCSEGVEFAQRDCT